VFGIDNYYRCSVGDKGPTMLESLAQFPLFWGATCFLHHEVAPTREEKRCQILIRTWQNRAQSYHRLRPEPEALAICCTFPNSLLSRDNFRHPIIVQPVIRLQQRAAPGLAIYLHPSLGRPLKTSYSPFPSCHFNLSSPYLRYISCFFTSFQEGR